MSLLDMLSDEKIWYDFYKYKTALIFSEKDAENLLEYIKNKRYLRVAEDIAEGKEFPLPEKSVISKMSAQKKRIVYRYPEDENYVLKLLTYLLLRKYDYLFCRNLYSFRPGKTAKDAVRNLTKYQKCRGLYAYKADISNYFNSIPVEYLISDLKEILADDERLFSFLSSLLNEKRVISGGKAITEQKGIMAGTPVASFYANVFLRRMDSCFENLLYARYSDDIIVFADTLCETEQHKKFITDYLSERGLEINKNKEYIFSPDEKWSFLGFSFRNGVTDISSDSVDKIKAKMRRKTRALSRWKDRNGIESEKAARAFIRIFNKKLLDDSPEHELSWKLWFFPIINTAESLEIIDGYAQECIRYLISGTHTKARYNVRYSKLKELGYRSLVHEYYATKKSEISG